MTLTEILGTWRIAANDFPATLQLWRVGNALTGQIKFDSLPNTENLAALSFSSDQINFSRTAPNQRYTG